jgi:hypothetical protein
MKIDRSIVSRHWEQAAVEQLSSQLQSEGYSVQREVPFGNVKADLVARMPDGSFTIFEIKVPGENGNAADWARQASSLRDQARALGGRFQLVIVRPPREREVEIDGLETALRDALLENAPEGLKKLSTEAVIDDVSDIDISSIAVRRGDVQISGEGTVTVTLHSDDDKVHVQESFPFSFRARLDRSNRITQLEGVEVDLSSWDGQEGGTDNRG